MVGAILRRLHAEFVRGRSPRSRAIGPAAAALGILPIGDNWEQDFGIRIEDGAVMWFNRDPPYDPREEPDSRVRLSILNAARFKHSELGGLIPPRPDDAVDCMFCDGRGERTGGDSVLRPCPHCAGGWLPRHLAHESK